MDLALTAVQWVVGKALAPVADGVLEAWEASKNLGLNIEALKMELLLVQATLETASRKEIGGQAMEQLLQKLRDSAHSAEDLLDELDYFRIHDQLHGTYDAADQHGKGGVHDHVLHARHTAKAVSKLTLLSSCWPAASPADPGQEDAREQTSCCARPCVKHRARGNSSSAPDSNQANEEVRGCMPKLGKFFPRSSSPDVAVDDETPKLGFDRVDVSERMKQIVEELQPVRREITTILQSCGPITVRAISQSRPITTSQSIEPKLYGRDRIVNSIIHDITNGKYCGKDLCVLPIVGPGGIGKTTLVQHIYINQEVQNHFPVRVWVCVSLTFDLHKLLEEIKRQSPRVDPEEKEGTTEQLIEQRLKSRRFLLVLDDIWQCSNEDDWKRLLLPLKKSQGNGSMIIVTTRFPAIAQMVKRKTSDISVELEGLDLEEFQKLFFSFVFDDEKSRTDNNFLLETGYKIMDKLKGSPLAAKTVGRLLKADLNLRHWRRVLESKEWERQTGSNDIMSALQLSYDYLPFQQQQCFSYSALFPEDHKYNSTKLINFWMGLNILQPGDRNQTLEDIGLNSLNNLVSHGFFKEEGTDGHLHYVMHDLLHDLALKVASHECLSFHHSDMRSVEIQPSIRHLSIIIDDVGGDNADEKYKSELRKLKAKLKVGHLQTLMLFGEVDERFTSIFGDFFSEANSLRVLHLPNMHCPLESLLHYFSRLVHLRYLYLGTEYRRVMHLPVTISILYHLKVLDAESCYKCLDFPRDISNLAKLLHFYTPIDELHSDISNVGKLKLLQELKVFRVHKESEGFELKQLEHLTELRELGIYNLEEIHTKEEASKANLREKNYLERLTLDWGSEKANVDPDGEAVVESLQPHRDLQKLTIRGHRGGSCPKWLGDELEVKDLQSFHLSGVSWEDFPSLGKMCDLREVTLERIATMKEFVVEQSFCRLRRLTLIGLEILEKWVPSQDSHHMFPIMQVMVIRDCPKLSVLPFSNQIICPADQERNMDWFPKLQELQVHNCPEFLLEARIPWTETLHRVNMRGVKLLEEFYYSKSSDGVSLSISGKDDLQSIDQVLATDILTEVTRLRFEKGPCLELRHLLMLTSLKILTFKNCQSHVFAPRSSSPVGPSGGQGDVKWDLPAVENLMVEECGASGNELTELLTHLPRLSNLTIRRCEKITHLAVWVDQRQRTSSATSDSEAEEAAASEREDGGLLLLPAHLSDSLRELHIYSCPELVLVDPPTLPPGGGGLQALRFLRKFSVSGSPKFLSACLVSSPSRFLFPSSLQSLDLCHAVGMGTLDLLSNLTSLTCLGLRHCGEDLRCEGLGPLLGHHLRRLIVFGIPRFFAGRNPNARRVLQHEGGGEEQRRQIVSPLPSSSKLQELYTDDAEGLLAAPICSLLSSSLTELYLWGTKDAHLERFTNDGLHLLVSLQELVFIKFDDLLHLPAGLHKLPNLKRLKVVRCPALRALPEDGLPKSLQYLDVSTCGNEDLIQQCRGLVGTIPKIYLED